MEAHDALRTALHEKRTFRPRGERLSVAVSSERVIIAALVLLFAGVTALTWRRWGIVDFDTGTELTVADRISHGSVLYRDVRYYYGPAGVYSLALMFKVFGTSLVSAYAFGLVQATAILAAFYALARTWVRPLTAGLAVMGLLLLGYTGWANLVLPNSNSGTFGVLLLLLTLLALTRDRTLLAGVCLGGLALTRLEFAAAGVAAGVLYAVGLWRTDDRRAALRALLRMAIGAIVVAAPVLIYFAAEAGTTRLITQNLLPVGVAGTESKFQSNLSPLSFTGLLATIMRGSMYVIVAGGLVAAAWLWPRYDGRHRVRALWPLAAGLLGLLALDGLSRALDAFPGTRTLLQTGVHRGLVSTTWLPALVLVLAVWAGWRLLRRRSPLISPSWPLELALLGTAGVLAFRDYNNFSADTYAPYYAAPLLLLAAAAHERISARWPAAGRAVIAVFALGMLSIAIPLRDGLMAGNSQPVHTARGTYLSSPVSATDEQRTVAYIDAHSRPGEPILNLPYGGIYFSVDRPPALYNLTFLPGDVATTAEQQTTIAALARQRVRLIAVSNATFAQWGEPHFGVDYDQRLWSYIVTHYAPVARFGNFADTSGGPLPRAYVVYRLRQAPSQSSNVGR